MSEHTDEPSSIAPELHDTSSYKTKLFGGLSGRYRDAGAPVSDDFPLLVALHGGTFDSRFFDVPNFSFSQRAKLLGLPVLAPDRPGYGESPGLKPGQQRLPETQSSCEWRSATHGENSGSARGVVIVGHSIGAAIALLITAESRPWPLLGLCISGLGLRTPAGSRDAVAALPVHHRGALPAVVRSAEQP